MTRIREAGFSLIEMLIASFMLLLVVLGLVPLIAQSIRSNETAEETSDLVRAAQLEMEGLVQLPFNHSALTVASGESMTSTAAIFPTVSYELDDPLHTQNHPVDSTVTIRHFNIAAIDDGVLDENDALEAGMPANLVHFKQIVLEVERDEYAWGLPVGTAEIQMIKAN